MGINIENLIDLSLLKEYDSKLRKWAIEQGSTENVQFTTNSSLPQTGKIGVLYVTEDTIKLWNGSEYVDVGSGSGQWSTF